ncbi:ATP synthase F0 subunit B [Patescibacteria group bacterium]|nr:MAG: ATP synthase F0 subunit B [Patescibacteria group bacterium]
MFLIDIAYASESAEAAAETASGGGVLASLGIDPVLLIFQLINFAVVAAILWFLILKPLTKKMAERQNMIDDSLQNVKKIEDNLARSEQKYQERIDQAKVEASKILEKTNQEAVELGDNLKKKAKKEIELLVDQAKRNIKIEHDEMAAQIRASAAELVVAAVEKVLGEKLKESDDKKVISHALKDLGEKL